VTGEGPQKLPEQVVVKRNVFGIEPQVVVFKLGGPVIEEGVFQTETDQQTVQRGAGRQPLSGSQANLSKCCKIVARFSRPLVQYRMVEGAYDEREAGTRRTNPEHAGVCKRRQATPTQSGLARCFESSPASASRHIETDAAACHHYANGLASISARGIRQRVRDFKAHQEKMAREREDYYLQMKARMLASVPTVSLPTL
jgi:hypothetical protein